MQKQLNSDSQNTKKSIVKIKKKKMLIKKSKDIAIKKMDVKKVKDFIVRMAYMMDDPERIMKELSEDVSLQTRIDKFNKKTRKKTNETVAKALMLYGLDTHYPLAETVGEKYKPLVIEFSHQLIQEYNCQTSSEKALAEIVVGAYSRIIKYSEKMNSCMAQELAMDNRLVYFSYLSKEIDRANRQFLTAFTTLKQLKTPPLKINVKTKTAFIAQNQQLNTNSSNQDNSNKNENIKPK